MTLAATDSTAYAYDRLARLIELRLPASNRRLPSAAALSRDLGVSRPVVLDALKRLSDEGRVVVSPGAGGIWAIGGTDEGRQQREAWARDNAETIADMAVLRRILEPGIARHLATRGISRRHLAEGAALIAQMKAVAWSDRDQLGQLDSDFHLLMGRATRRPVLLAQLETCRAWVSPMFEFVAWPDDREDQSIEDHESIWQAVERGDAAEAESLMVRHVDLSVGLIHDALRRLGAVGLDEQGED